LTPIFFGFAKPRREGANKSRRRPYRWRRFVCAALWPPIAGVRLADRVITHERALRHAQMAVSGSRFKKSGTSESCTD